MSQQSQPQFDSAVMSIESWVLKRGIHGRLQKTRFGDKMPYVVKKDH